MAANAYYNNVPQTYDHDQQHLLPHSILSQGISSGRTSPMKPLHLLSNEQNAHFNYSHGFDEVHQLTQEDARLKIRIRRLRLISRILALFISVAVLVPITMTVYKFVTTQNTYRTVTLPSGKTTSRTAWAHDTRAWPMWTYFGVAAISVILNFCVIFTYRYSVEKANVANYVASTFDWIIIIGNLTLWITAASIYRAEKDKNNKPNDIWGWTCSAAARAIQKEFKDDIDFNAQCNIQSASWYVGLVQVGACLLTLVIFGMAYVRRQGRKRIRSTGGVFW